MSFSSSLLSPVMKASASLTGKYSRIEAGELELKTDSCFVNGLRSKTREATEESNE